MTEKQRKFEESIFEIDWERHAVLVQIGRLDAKLRELDLRKEELILKQRREEFVNRKSELP